MTLKNPTLVKSVRFPNSMVYRFYGFTFELPSDAKFLEIEIRPKRYIIHTSHDSIVMRPCNKCKRLLELHDFYAAHSCCKSCHVFMVRRWNKKNPDLVKQYAKKYSKKYRYQKKLISAGVQ